MTDPNQVGNDIGVTSIQAKPREAMRSRRRAFVRLYRAHFGLVWSLARHLGVPDAHHEDVLQEVWLLAYRRLHTLDPTASAKAWLGSITRNVVLHHHRAWHRRRRKHASLAVVPPENDDNPARRHAAGATVVRVLEGMDEGQRLVLVLAQVHGLSGPEIATALGIPLNTMYSRLRLARQHVAQVAANDDELTRIESPPRRAANKAWALLVPHLGARAAVPVAVAAPWAVLKVVVPATAIAAATLGLVAVIAPGPAATVATSAADPLADRPNSDDAHLDTRSDAGPIVASSIAVASSTIAPRQLDPSSPPTTRERSPQSYQRGRTKSSAKRDEPPTTEDDPGSESSTPPNHEPAAAANPVTIQSATAAPGGLAEETRMLLLAQNALTEGDPTTALAVLKQHDAAYPEGQLATAREGVWVRALCDAGRGQDARARAARLSKQQPASAVAVAVQDVCRDRSQ